MELTISYLYCIQRHKILFNKYYWIKQRKKMKDLRKYTYCFLKVCIVTFTTDNLYYIVKEKYFTSFICSGSWVLYL